MELRSGAGLVAQQYRALLKKNAILTWRHKRSAFLQLFSSLFFIFLIFCIDRAIRSRFSSNTAYKNVYDPEAIVSPPIPPCEDKFFIKKPCFDFVWSGNSSARIARIVSAIMRNNPGRSIPSDKVKSFSTPEEVDAWLFSDPMHCPGALHFVETNATVISYGIQTNSTPVAKRGNYEDPTFKFQIPLQVAAEREIARSLIGDPNFSWEVGFKEFAHPATETFSAVGTAGPTFFLAIAMFGFVFQISSLVAEKELRLRQAMSIMGLYESAYWLSWLTWEAFLTLLAALFTVLFGMMFQFDFFLNNSFAVLFVMFFLFQLNMVAFAFMISTFISKSSAATTVGFSIFIVGFLTQLVTTFGFPYTDSFSKTYRVIWSLFPPNLLAKALDLLGNATATSQDKGISWKGRGECTAHEPDCVINIQDIYEWLISTFFLWFVLAIYLDNIIPNSNGVRKSILYFLNPSYWTGKGGNKVEGGICSCTGSIPPLDDAALNDEDVLAEETTVKQQVANDEIDSSVAVQIRGLRKTYPGTTNIGCCKCRKTPPYHAVKGIWLNLAKDQLFCLLGPNGAGKTTVISCLTGITPITGGDALIYGYSVRSSVGMSNIRRLIGVCPQFDILWDELSAEEHLHLFASIKGLHPSTIKSVTEKSLAEVKLTNAAKVRAGSYSGGMKRRLSVAIALIGDPKLVFLDEPTTGMDPITRRHVWDIIEDAKRGRSIILTTHSMEEADILSDRIAIMAKGKLHCIGTSIRLKSRFGTGYITNVSFLGNTSGQTPNTHSNEATSELHLKLVMQFFKEHLNLNPKEESKTFLTFVIPHEKEGLLTSFFSELQDREKEFGISDIQLGLTTLEEVFLNIAKQAELDSSAEGNLVTLNLSSGTSIQIPKGARFVGIPGTESSENPGGLMVEVYWEQDDSGNLCISGHSSETPIPPNIQLTANPALSRRSFRRESAPIVGYVIDPDQVLNGQ
ncbi:ABC transporter A family member 2 isoform X2 [Elaeis guineensis]|uniref:ABC transporter A family member 2 isoform X2 n=1 Tax=Elaeis guineensis var. tenera TaxID=51953 RepID=A0A6I9S0G2_ELAGV|nr:ABC transporter A family member 2 isoform X2 [Elaeis guineensis]